MRDTLACPGVSLGLLITKRDGKGEAASRSPPLRFGLSDLLLRPLLVIAGQAHPRPWLGCHSFLEKILPPPAHREGSRC